MTVNQKDGFVTQLAQMPIAEYSATLAKNLEEFYKKLLLKIKLKEPDKI